MQKKKSKWIPSRRKKLRECCDAIFYAFECPSDDDCPPYVSAFIDSIAPWENFFDKIELQDIEVLKKTLRDDHETIFGMVYDVVRTSFALGYTCGQLFDTHDTETGLIEKAMREKKALLFLPHKKKEPKERREV